MKVTIDSKEELPCKYIPCCDCEHYDDCMSPDKVWEEDEE